MLIAPFLIGAARSTMAEYYASSRLCKGSYIWDAACGVWLITMHWVSWPIRADCAFWKEGLCRKLSFPSMGTRTASPRGRYGKSACTVSFFYVKAPLSSCPSFRGKRGSRLLPAIRDPPLPRHGGNEISSWMWPMSERGTAPFRARRPRTRVSCWIVTMWSFWHNQIQRLVLFSAYEQVFGGCGS